jgi:hypothetical protein
LHDNQGISIEVLDIETNTKTIYSSIKEAAEFIGCRPDMISRYFTRNTQKPYRGRYILKKLSS